MLTWAIARVVVSGAVGWPLLLAGIAGDIVLELIVAAIWTQKKRLPE